MYQRGINVFPVFCQQIGRRKVADQCTEADHRMPVCNEIIGICLSVALYVGTLRIE